MIFDAWIEKRVACFQSEIMCKYYDEIESMYSKMRGWRHDYRHHTQVMKAHLQNGEYEDIADYLDRLDDDLTNVETVIKTGNRMADAILNSKLTIAVQRGITCKCKAQIPVALTTPEIDLCIVIGNLLDNAIEACTTLSAGQRLIRVYLEMKGSYLYLSVTNTAPGVKQTAVNGLFRSVKGEGHGLGIKRVDAIVKKYGGYCKRASEDGAFSTEVLLPQG